MEMEKVKFRENNNGEQAIDNTLKEYKRIWKTIQNDVDPDLFLGSWTELMCRKTFFRCEV